MNVLNNLDKDVSNDSGYKISLESKALEFINQGNLIDAEKIYRDLINKGTNNHVTYGNLAIICGVKGNSDDMIMFLRKSIEIEPRYAQGYNNLGIALREDNQLDSSIRLFEEAISIKPDYADAYLNLGIVFYRKNNINEAIKYFKKALQIDPTNLKVFNNLGISYEFRNDFKNAIIYYKKALEIDPLSSETNTNLANTLLKRGKINEAIMFYRKSIKLDPNNSSSHNNLASALKSKGLIREAMNEYHNAIKIDPNNPKAHFNLGIILEEIGENSEAINSYKASLKIDPEFVEAYTNLGIVLQDQGSVKLAINYYKTALKLEPKNAKTRWNLAIAQLLTGNYKDGWRNYDWRLNNLNSNKLHSSPKTQPVFDNILNLNENLLVITEQGLGDTIQYMRYIPYLRNLGFNICFSAQTKLHNLIQVSNIDSNPITPDEANLVSDRRWIPLLSLPRNLGVTAENPIVSTPYIKTKKELFVKWKNQLSHENRPIVGINWQGSLDMEKESYKGRSIPLEFFSILLKRNDIKFLSLQKGYGSDQFKDCSFKNKFVSCQNKIDQIWEFTENAAIAANCDLIITCDTCMAHLAGGMGLKVWLLLKDVPFWTWGLCSNNTFWYPSMRLFRQYKKNDWITLFEKLGSELRKELNYLV